MLSGPSNFKLWHSTLQSILKLDDLWDVIGEDPPPAPKTSLIELTDPGATLEVIHGIFNTTTTSLRQKQVQAKSYIELSFPLKMWVYIEDI